MTFRRPLAGLALLGLLLAGPVARSADVAWRKDYAAARIEAQQTNRPLLLTFCMDDCPWCDALDTSTYRDPTVVKFLGERVVPLKVHKDEYPGLVRDLGIQSFPTIVVASPQGRILEVHKGYLKPAALGEMLGRAVAKVEPATPAAPVETAGPKEAPAKTVKSPDKEVPAKTATTTRPVPEPPGVPEPPAAGESVAKSGNVPEPPSAVTSPAERNGPGEWMEEDLRRAAEFIAHSEFSRAMSLLRRIVQAENAGPAQAKATALMRDVERQAADRLAKVKEAELQNRLPEAVSLARDLVTRYDGTEAAAEALTMLAGLNTRLEEKDRERLKQARMLTVLAREDYRSGQYLPCLLRCEEVIARYADLPEATEAGELAAQIKNNPERLQKICDNLPEVLGPVYLMTAELKIRQGEPQQAVFFLERVLQAFPHSKHAEVAQVRLSQIQGPPALNGTDDRKP